MSSFTGVVPYTEYYVGFLLILSTAFTVFIWSAPSQYDPYHVGQHPTNKDSKVTTSVQVVVLGDIGRSPRMQNHATSIARYGGRVHVVGYRETDPHPDLLSDPLITIVPIAGTPTFLQTSNKALFLLTAPVKVLWQVWSLYYTLSYHSEPAKWMLVQNPPSIPTLAVAMVVCFSRNTQLVIDWHNFGYSILALKLGRSHPLVAISKVYEHTIARLATAHIAVTNAMCRILKKDFRVTALALHDRPPKHFQPLSPDQRFAFLGRLPETAQYVDEIEQGAWKLVVSSTSWTADEDFSVLLDALVTYSARATTLTKLPKILAIITGKGPQKEHYLSCIRRMNQDGDLNNVLVLTAWLTSEDYAQLLGSADLGVSLHTSSSGVDLPMKVVDMFGTGLPVVGWSDFEAWSELVKEDVNGKGFASADGLSDLLIDLFGGDGRKLKSLREGALRECEQRWDSEWDPVAGKLFRLVK